MKLVFATNNSNKLIELKASLNPKIEVISQKEIFDGEAEETGLTFVENALIKARFCAKHTKLPVIAEDSGLCVKALKGSPGLYSKIYAGEHASSVDNINKLLEQLKEVPNNQREAFFYCCMVYIEDYSYQRPIIFEGSWHGIINEINIGKKGFGYDPIFYIPEIKKTAAELTSIEKNKLSHRGQCILKLQKFLESKI